jgi:hypothetical protein
MARITDSKPVNGGSSPSSPAILFSSFRQWVIRSFPRFRIGQVVQVDGYTEHDGRFGRIVERKRVLDQVGRRYWSYMVLWRCASERQVWSDPRSKNWPPYPEGCWIWQHLLRRT